VRLRWAHRSRPFPGETANGDRPVALERDGCTLLAVIDALGHGPRAEEAAILALRALDAWAGGSLSSAFDAVDVALRGSRGAAMTAVLFGTAGIEAAGIGNVALRSSGFAIPFVQTPGVLGAQRRALRLAQAPRATGRLLLASDGISTRLDFERVMALEPDAACEHLLDAHGSSHDDATALIVDVS
jgi:negative regulator of sigma-B (phosphoserine phosphatase)